MYHCFLGLVLQSFYDVQVFGGVVADLIVRLFVWFVVVGNMFGNRMQWLMVGDVLWLGSLHSSNLSLDGIPFDIISF